LRCRRDDRPWRSASYADSPARERGADIEREARLEREVAELRDAGPLRRLIAMAGDFDPAIANETLRDFEPAAKTLRRSRR
jgi:hypothetical protein